MKAQFTTELHEGKPVYRLSWDEVKRLLGREHRNCVSDDAKLARALRAAGAKPKSKSYSAADGWHAYAPKGTKVPVRTSARPGKALAGARARRSPARATRGSSARAVAKSPPPVGLRPKDAPPRRKPRQKRKR